VPFTQIVVVPLQKISARWTERPLPFSELILSTKNLKWEEMNLSLGDNSRPTSESTSLNNRFLSLARSCSARQLESSPIPPSVLLCLHRQWRLLQCGWNWRMSAIFRKEKHRLPDQCNVLLVALKRSRTESQTTHRTAISRVFTFVIIIRFSVLFHWLMLSLWPKIRHNFFYFAYRGAPKTAGP